MQVFRGVVFFNIKSLCILGVYMYIFDSNLNINS